MAIGSCCCFNVETGGVIIATWNTIQVSIGILYLLFKLITDEHNRVTFIAKYVLPEILAAVLFISLLSIKGIEKRNHSFILPMLIWLYVALLFHFIFSGIDIANKFKYGGESDRIFILPIIFFEIIFIAFEVLSIAVFYALYVLFKDEPRRGQDRDIYQQQFVPTTGKVELRIVDNP